MRPLAAFSILAICSSFASAQTPAEVLVKRLGSPHFAQREQAARQLEALGRSALPLLRAASSKVDLESRRRCFQIMERIENRIFVQEVTDPKTVNLKFVDVPLEDVVQSMQAHLAMRIEVPEAKSPRITLNTSDVPFWLAWSQFCEAAGVEEADYLRPASRMKKLRPADFAELLDGLDRPQPSSSVRYVAPRVHRATTPLGMPYAADNRHSVRVRVHRLPAEAKGDRQAAFLVEVRPEPGLELAGVPRVQIKKVVCSDGTTLDVDAKPQTPSPDQPAYLASHSGDIHRGNLFHIKRIAWPNRDLGIRELHGSVQAEFVVRPKLFAVPNVMKAVGKAARGFEGIEAKVIDAERNEDGDLAVRLRLSDLDSLKPSTTQQEIVRVRPGFIAIRGAIDVAMDCLELHAPNGRVFRPERATHRQLDGGKGYDVSLTFAAPETTKDDYTLVITKERRIVAVEFAFKVGELR